MMTIQQYLQGLISYPLNENIVESALINIQDLNGVFHDSLTDVSAGTVTLRPSEMSAESDVKWFPEKGRDLMLANMYYFMNSIISGGGEKVKRGQLEVSGQSYTIGITDRKRWKEMGDALYAKWSEIPEEEFVRLFPE